MRLYHASDTTVRLDRRGASPVRGQNGVPLRGSRGEPVITPDQAGLRELFAQLAAEDFSRGGARDRIDEIDFARLLVVGKAVGNEDAQVLL